MDFVCEICQSCFSSLLYGHRKWCFTTSFYDSAYKLKSPLLITALRNMVSSMTRHHEPIPSSDGCFPKCVYLHKCFHLRVRKKLKVMIQWLWILRMEKYMTALFCWEEVGLCLNRDQRTAYRLYRDLGPQRWVLYPGHVLFEKRYTSRNMSFQKYNYLELILDRRV